MEQLPLSTLLRAPHDSTFSPSERVNSNSPFCQEMVPLAFRAQRVFPAHFYASSPPRVPSHSCSDPQLGENACILTSPSPFLFRAQSVRGRRFLPVFPLPISVTFFIKKHRCVFYRPSLHLCGGVCVRSCRYHRAWISR